MGRKLVTLHHSHHPSGHRADAIDALLDHPGTARHQSARFGAATLAKRPEEDYEWIAPKLCVRDNTRDCIFCIQGWSVMDTECPWGASAAGNIGNFIPLQVIVEVMADGTTLWVAGSPPGSVEQVFHFIYSS